MKVKRMPKTGRVSSIKHISSIRKDLSSDP